MSAGNRERDGAAAFVSIVVCLAIAAAVVLVLLAARGRSSPGRARAEARSRLHRPDSCVSLAVWSRAVGLPCPPAPYRPRDFVYTCAWIASHLAEAVEARVSCDTP